MATPKDTATKVVDAEEVKKFLTWVGEEVKGEMKQTGATLRLMSIDNEIDVFLHKHGL